ncbi:MAG TPA: S4 domain-containing protein, partial [Casimicrobiaceae bacterium]
MTEPVRLRLDKWLWAARFYKTRTLAAQAVDAGQVRVGGERVKIAHAVRTGERLTIRKAAYLWDVTVTA